MSEAEISVGSKRKSRGSNNHGNSSNATNHVKRHSISLNQPVVTELAPECSAGIRVTFRDITAAAYRTKSGIQKTPLVKSGALSSILGLELYLKKEYELRTGSFKERGARNALLKLSEEERKVGVIAASAGNHALALAYHGGQLDITVTVVMPVVAPIMKISQCQEMGANVIVHGATIAEAKDHAMIIKEKGGQIYINGYDHPDIIAGQGTIGLEICSQVEDIDAIIVPVGGAGLIAGVAVAAKNMNPDVKIIGVEAMRCMSYTEALKAGKPVRAASHVSLADGLAVPTVGLNAFVTAQPLVDKIVTVSEKAIALAILRLIEMEKAVVEGSGVVGLAALLDGLLPELKGKKVVTILCGGNIDTTVLGRCLERGLAADGRLLSFTVVVKDAPGGMNSLTQVLTESGASIKDILHERAWLLEDVFAVRVRCMVETRNSDHTEKVKNILSRKFRHVEFIGMSDHSTDTLQGP
ncbi:hypothetical protein ACHWQZ_G013056 [Mnemiopsis leidyi]